MSLSVSLLIATWACFCSIVLAQNAVPSNGTIPHSTATNGSLQLTVNSNSMLSTYEIHAAWAFDSANGPNATQLQSIVLTGSLVPTNTSNYNDLESGDFAFISCDPDAYASGFIGLKEVINGATSKVDPNAPHTLYITKGGGVVLYSTQAAWCNFTIPSGDTYTYDNVFSLTTASAANSLINLMQSDSQPASSSIHVDRSSLNNDTSNDDGSETTTPNAFGPSPTTTIAMVILYVITGVITLLFVVIIISGAVRAHRHPERYRGRTLMGRPVQGSRARGLAAAMLDTLPIVKFGERDQNKPNDVELQNGTAQQGTEAARNASGAETRPETQPDTATGDSDSAEAAAAGATPETSAEAGLACSVCTDDFVKGQDLRVLPCNHKFHPECIDPWLLNVSGTCPLCRVDLRPPESQSESTSPSDPNAPPATPVPNEPQSSASDRDHSPSSQSGSHSGPRNRMSTILHSSILHRALNRQHMSDATPEQRLEALRDLRNQNRAQVTAGEQDERMRSRVAGRIGRLLGRGGERRGDEESGSAEPPRSQ